MEYVFGVWTVDTHQYVINDSLWDFMVYKTLLTANRYIWIEQLHRWQYWEVAEKFTGVENQIDAYSNDNIETIFICNTLQLEFDGKCSVSKSFVQLVNTQTVLLLMKLYNLCCMHEMEVQVEDRVK